MANVKKILEIKDLVQNAIDQGATSVEQVHKMIANMPLDVLQKISPLEEPVKKVRDFQEQTIGNVYELIHSINHKAGEIATELLTKIDPQAATPAKGKGKASKSK